jgi:hypothetical protein
MFAVTDRKVLKIAPFQAKTDTMKISFIILAIFLSISQYTYITGGRFDMPERFRSKEFDDKALFRSKMKHRVARWTDAIQSVDKGMLFYSGDAGHFIHYDDPELVISSIRIVLQDYEILRTLNEE